MAPVVMPTARATSLFVVASNPRRANARRAAWRIWSLVSAESTLGGRPRRRDGAVLIARKSCRYDCQIRASADVTAKSSRCRNGCSAPPPDGSGSADLVLAGGAVVTELRVSHVERLGHSLAEVLVELLAAALVEPDGIDVRRCAHRIAHAHDLHGTV